MNRHLFKRALAVGIFAIAAGTILLSQYFASTGVSGWFHPAVQSVSRICQDLDTQWIVILCLAAYISSFSFVDLWLLAEAKSNQFQWRGLLRSVQTSDLCLVAFLFVTLMGYFLKYESTPATVNMVVLIGSVACGKAARLCLWPRNPTGRDISNLHWLVGTLILILTGLALCRANFNRSFAYYTIGRWNGPWDNPNIYGLLMGTGVVMAVGMLLRDWITMDGRWRKIFRVLLCSLAAIVCGIGLFKSYSRGAWLAALGGLSYLALNWFRSEFTQYAIRNTLRSPFASVRVHSWLKKNWIPLLVAVVSIFVVCFWQFRFIEWRPARRAFSVANINDFSWRNRVVAWEGALRMMKHKLWFGYGWGAAESVYEKEYCPPNLENGLAIQMNDYFMLGISAGLPLSSASSSTSPFP